MCLAFLLRLLWIAYFMRGADVEPMGVDDARMAQELVEGGFATALAAHGEGVAILYSMVLAGASSLTRGILAFDGTARLVAAIFGSLLVVPVYSSRPSSTTAGSR